MSARDPRTVERSRRIVGERKRATAILTRRGESATSIAMQIGVTPRTVIRYRAQLRQAA